ncbi:MAG: fimbrial biogenesis outer membrane usher protein [Acidobacteria bacterium]|nr:fimbrial biogenesis outer membrane usher protein [Acidobacteriota bacterium]
MKRLALSIAGQAVLLGLLWTPLSAQPPATADQIQRAFFEVLVNGTNLGDMLVLLGQADVWVPVEVLERAGLKQATGTRRDVNGQVFVSLKSLAPDLTYEIDETALVVKIAATSQLFGVNVITVQSGRPADIEYGGRPAVFLNYGLNYRPSSASDAAVETGANLGRAFFSTTASLISRGHFVRGLSQLIMDDRGRMRRFTVGDRFVSTGVLGGSALVGGVTLSRDFGLDPYFVRYPTLDFSGAVTTPSTVDVYVNDRLVSRAQIAPGEFELRRIPVPNGSGDTRLVIRDAFGRTREVSAPYYLTTSLLSQGVHDYTYSAGWARQQSGITSWSYGDPVFLGMHRVGVTTALSLGFRGEAGRDLWNAGPIVNARLGRLGETELVVARSQAAGTSGSALSVGYRYQGHLFSAGSVARYKTPFYATVSQAPRDPKTRVEMNSFFGVLIGPLLSVTAQHDIVENYPRLIVERKRVRTTATISSRLSSRFNLFVSLGQLQLDSLRSREVAVSLSTTLGSRRIATVTAEDGATGSRTSFEIQQSTPVGNGLGYRFHAETGAMAQTGGKVTSNTPYGRYEAEYQNVRSAQATTLSVAGGLVAIDRRFFVTRPVDDSFAVVKVPGVRGVRTYASNQEIGRTNRSGYLLVPNLLPYYGNVLSISDQDIPFDYSLDKVIRIVAPPYRGGSLVTFGATKRRAVSGTVAIEARGETIIPAYGQLSMVVDQASIESPIGHYGEFYLDGVPAGSYPARIAYRGETCEFTLHVPTSTDPVVRVGSVRCLVR